MADLGMLREQLDLILEGISNQNDSMIYYGSIWLNQNI